MASIEVMLSICRLHPTEFYALGKVMLKRAFGQNLQALRERCNKSRKTVQRETGLSYSFLQALENGEKQPTLTSIILLAAALEATPDELVMPVWAEWNAAGQPEPDERVG